MSLAASSKPPCLRLEKSPGGSDPGPDGEGRCLAMPGEGARRGGVARPSPLSSLMWYTKLSCSL